MDIEKLKAKLVVHEGKRDKVYLDTLGLKTAGIGHLLVGNEIRLTVGSKVTEGQINNWFAQDLKTAIALSDKFLLNIEIDDNRKSAIVNMCFNLGNKIFQFKKFQAALREKKYDIASKEMLSSLWAQQVGNRAKELSNVIKGV